MHKFAIGTKQEMTQVFNEEGRVFPATILKMDSLKVTQVKGSEKDGYEAIQVGGGVKSDKNINNAQKKIGSFRFLRELRLKKPSDAKVGDEMDMSVFEKGDIVTVSAISKGKGFQGGVKRYGFKGGRRSHGNKHAERQPGSIGATGPQRVFKGTRMAGRMGTDKVSVKNLKVLDFDIEKGLLYIGGAVPGRRGTLVTVRGN